MPWEWDRGSLHALEGFLRSRGLVEGAVKAERIGDGHSNLTFLITSGPRRLILRRPPPPPTPPGANDMLREARLATALASTEVPVAEVVATSNAGEVLDVDFYVSELIEGPVITTTTPAPLDDPGCRRQIGHDLVDRLAAIHAVDWTSAGLGDLGHPEGFNERHVRRMARLVADGESGRLPGAFAPLHDWLRERAPAESGATIVHNDYRLGNVLVAPDAPGRILAVLDWELATLGDPLFDVGYLLASVPEPGRPPTPTQEMTMAMLEPGWPDRSALAGRYAEASGRDVGGLEWYTALALWKLAVLYEHSRRRAVAGAGDPYYLDPTMVPAFLVAGHRTASLSQPVEGEVR